MEAEVYLMSNNGMIWLESILDRSYDKVGSNHGVGRMMHDAICPTRSPLKRFIGLPSCWGSKSLLRAPIAIQGTGIEG